MNEDYSQPTFYHFSEDSVLLAKWAARSLPDARSLLDIFSGCGVVGIEVAKLIPIRSIEFVELQEDFLSLINENVSKFLPKDMKSSVFIGPLSTWSPQQSFDIIVANPPYFLSQTGQVSKDLKRHKARSMIVDDWDILIQKVALAMHSKSHAFIVIRFEEKLLYRIEKICLKHGLKIVPKYKKKLVLLDIFALNENGNEN